ncbi:MAG TPA: PAS domain S-box protein [Thermoanaerobaculia bacterium]
MPEQTPEELALLLGNILDCAIFLLSPTGEIQTWNRGAERIMGYTAEDALGSHVSRFYVPEDLAARRPDRELEGATAAGRVEVEGWRVRKDGGRFWANTVITALRDAGGQLRGFAKVTRDLTERRNAEERLRRSEEMFRLLVESVQDYAIFMLDPTGDIVTWNLGAQRIKGYQPHEVLGKHFSIFYSAEDVSDGKPERELAIAKAEGSVEDEGWRIRKDGTRFWANVIITAVHDENGSLRGFAKVTRDITVRKEAEETRRALLEQREARLQAEEERRHAEMSYFSAQEANRAKDEFLMTLSHELRTPMTAILGWSRMLPTINPADPMFREAVRAIGRSADLQARLIDDVLDVSRIVSGKLRLSLNTEDVAPVLQAAVDAVRPSAEARSIDIILKLAPDLGAATFDSTRLQQIVWNLLSNAIKFTPKKGSVELSAKRTSSQVHITVRDSGDGIDPEFLPHVFEAFRQAENPSTRVHGGLGLGLSIVRYLTEAHGGRVTAESDGRGKGACFKVMLPIRPLRISSNEPQEQRGVRTPLGGRRILVVDDDPEGRELVASVLRLGGAEVWTVDSANAALDYLEDHRTDLVLTDIAMPEVDGYALQRILRKRGDLAKTKIVALTAFPATATSGEETDFDSYLRKPIDPWELTERVSEVLRTA